MTPWTPQARTVFRAAWLYYVAGAKQDDVAEALGLSRASVTLYLKKAREAGLVQVRMDPGPFRHLHAAQALETRFGLTAVAVVPALDADPLVDVARAAWLLLEPHLASARRLAVAWGRTVYAVARQLPATSHPGLEVLQLCGNIGASPYGLRPDASTFLIARQLGAEPRNLYAPLIVASARTASELRAEPVLRDHMADLAQSDVALFSPGSLTPDSHIVTSGTALASDVARFRAAGARAVIAGHLLAEDGRALDLLDDRLLSLPLADLARVPVRLAAASGADKAEAVAAMLRGGHATHLVLDEALAQLVLDLTAPPEEGSPA